MIQKILATGSLISLLIASPIAIVIGTSHPLWMGLVFVVIIDLVFLITLSLIKFNNKLIGIIDDTIHNKEDLTFDLDGKGDFTLTKGWTKEGKKID